MIAKLLIITLIIITFFIIITKQIENFSDNYINTNEIPIDYYKIYSSIPYDIKAKNEQSAIYDYDNDELNEKFISIFNINSPKVINLIEGIEWSKWYNINENNYDSYMGICYNNTINEFNKKLIDEEFDLPNNNNKFKIIDKTLNRYKKSSDNKYLLDIDIIIYRNNKPLARHIKLLSVCSINTTTIIMAKIVGVINEKTLHDDNLKSANENINLAEFIPERVIDYNTLDYIYDMDDKLVNTQISNNLYNKLLKEMTV